MKQGLIILALLLTGCSRVEEINEKIDEDEGKFGFERLYTRTSENMVFVCDSELHVEYIVIASSGGSGIGISPRYDRSGLPKDCYY